MMVFNPFAAIASSAPCPQSTTTRADADLFVLPTLGVDSTSPSITNPSLCHRRSQGSFATPKSGHHRSHLPRRRTHRAPCYVPSQMSRRHRYIPPPLPQRRQYPATSPARTAQYTCTG
ncbi:hypothetical protein M0R45_002057 [Rubus argutus]|uniref:Uncharacterized protein n=1 Tax=Rubus argutus TaxID=59490 RepID=A0AAW1VFR4_RUBAR